MIYIVLVIGLILRLISLNQSFWLDEATTANVAAMSVREILVKFSPGDFHPPLYYLIAHFWSNFFGIYEISLRMISVLAGLGTIYVLYLIGKELVDRKSGIVAALLLATSGLYVYYSQEARMYALATLFVSLTILFFVKITKRGRAGEWVLFAILLALVGLTDYVAIFVIPALWIYAWAKKLKPLWWKKFFASHIILIGTGLLWLPTFLKQLNAGLSVKTDSPFWWQILGQTNFKQLILIPTKFIFGRIDMEANLRQISLVSVVFLFFGFLLVRARQRLIWLWLLIPLVLGMITSFWIPSLSYFRFLFVLPALYLLIASGLEKLPKLVAKSILVILVVFNLITSSIYLFNNKNHREGWRALTGFIKKESEGKRFATVFAADSQQEAYRYYDKDAKILSSGQIDKSFDEIWLMRYVQEVFDPNDQARSRIEGLGYRKINEYDFNGVVVWRYERK